MLFALLCAACGTRKEDWVCGCGRRQGGIKRGRQVTCLASRKPDRPLTTAAEISSFLADTTNQFAACNLTPDVEAFYRDMSAKGVLFSMPPKKQDFGGVLAQFVDSEGAHCSLGAEAA